MRVGIPRDDGSSRELTLLISFVACRIAARAETDVRGEPWAEVVLLQGEFQ